MYNKHNFKQLFIVIKIKNFNLNYLKKIKKINNKMETEKSNEEQEQKDLSESWDWASAIAEG